MKLKAGNIYLFKYFRYKQDKQPLVLVLYHGMNTLKDKATLHGKPQEIHHEIIHGININYLKDDLTEELIDMMVKIAMKELNAKDMYRFYHTYIKRNLLPIISKAYRIYLVNSIGNPVPVSRGYNETRNFLLNMITSKKETYRVTGNKIRKEINLAKKNPNEIYKLSEKKEGKPSVKEILMSVDDYIGRLNEIRSEKFDKTKFTGIRRRKR